MKWKALYSIEIKSLVRNKRPREILFGLASLLLFNLLLCMLNWLVVEYDYLFFAAGITVTIFTYSLSYVTLLFSWQSAYFNRLLSLNIKPELFLFTLFLVSVTAPTLVAIILFGLYFIFERQMLEVIVASYLFNVGVIIPVLFWAAIHNTSKLDLNKKRSLNFEALSFRHFFVPVIVLIFYFIIIGSSYALFEDAYVLLALVGCMGILLTGSFVRKLFTRKFITRRYLMLHGFRQ